jgi:hypothetical protein
MKYIIFFLVLLLIFLLYANATSLMLVATLNEPFDSLAKIKTDKAISDAKLGGFESGFVETGAPVPEIDEKTADKIDYSKGLNNLDIEYHDSAEKIAKDTGYGLDVGVVFLYDPIQKKKIAFARPAIQNSATYYEPGTYKHGASTYVPDYSESVLLSKANNYFTDKTATAPTPAPLANFSFYNINAAESGMSKYTPGE